MRFASIGAQGNYAQSGKAAADDATKAYAVNRKYAPNYGALATTAMNIASDEKKKAMDIEKNLGLQGMKAAQSKKVTDVKSEMNQMKADGKRKAGLVAMLGGIGGGVGQAVVGKDEKPDYSRYDTLIDKHRRGAEATRASITDIDLTKLTDPLKSDSSSTATLGNSSAGGTGGTSTDAVGGGGIGGTDMDYMDNLVSKGYAPTTAAAIVGNMRYESGDFNFSEELAPNAYGTKGFGALQWTNAGDSTRRDDFMSWSQNNGLKPSSFEANAGFTAHEMVNGDSQGRSHWTGGSSVDGFRAQTDLGAATDYFARNYLRPAEATANYGERRLRSQDTLTRYQNRNNN